MIIIKIYPLNNISPPLRLPHFYSLVKYPARKQRHVVTAFRSNRLAELTIEGAKNIIHGHKLARGSINLETFFFFPLLFSACSTSRTEKEHSAGNNYSRHTEPNGWFIPVIARAATAQTSIYIRRQWWWCWWWWKKVSHPFAFFFYTSRAPLLYAGVPKCLLACLLATVAWQWVTLWI